MVATKIPQDIETVNIVAIADTGQPFRLDELAARLPWAMTPKSGTAAHWVQFRLPPENLYIAFYKSGKFLVTGCKSLPQVYDVVGRVSKLLVSLGYSVSVGEVRIHNIVAQGRIEAPLPLDRLYQSLPSGFSSYEPEQFPGLVVTVGGCRFLLFANGKFVCTGAKNMDEIHEAVRSLRSELRYAGVITDV